ncbi:MAG: 16S rRNA (cytosine(1402)-N(4))-methyltransferase RsmH, partial [Thermobifida sp.]|nr:16S rRNA (cytosine(1402)-N(4))-methyltransferase RsmH [Thermobifida sp.]
MRDASESVRDSSRRPDEGGCPASERHVPVLLAECLDMLAPAIEGPGAVLVDGTLGMGGHTEGALDRFPELTVIGIDRDPQAIALASERLERFGDRFRAVHTTYDRIDEAVAEQCGPGARIDGVLMDLGVSSLQLDEAERGFAYSKDAPLDMRMDATSGPSAADLLATASEGELIRILRTYGEEKFAPRIARLIIRRRDDAPITRTGELVDIIRAAIPAPARRTG